MNTVSNTMKMKHTLVLLALTAITAFGCQKKADDPAPAGPPGCPEGHAFSPHFSRCVVNGHCQTGFVQHPSQPTMCAEVRTGQTVTQRCATGFILTTHGCVPTCPNNPSMGLVANTCIQAVSGMEGGQNNLNYWNGNGQNGTSNYGYPTNYNNGYYSQPYSQYNGYPMWGAYGRMY